MTQRWDSLTFVHFEFEPAEVQALLPLPLRVDTFDGSAWVGLVPFEMRDVRLRGLPCLPGATTFCETNVRTYVTGPDGGHGVYFFSLDATPAAVVAFARATYRLPYRWSSMSIRREVAERCVRYECRRLLGATRGTRSTAVVQVGGPVAPTELDTFLTARWGLYQASRARVRFTPVDHEPWRLYDAEIAELSDELVAAAGLPEPEGRLVVRFSPGVDVRIGLPHVVR